MYRKINTRIWSILFSFYDLQPQDKLLCLYFLLNDHTNIHGLYRADINTICKETGMNLSITDESLKVLKGYEFINVLENGNYKITKKLMEYINWNHGKGGELSGNWKGGITPINAKIRASDDYKYWRSAVYLRDKFICQECGAKKNLNAHHIKPFAKYPELRFAVSNGITLCKDCHKELHKKGRR